MRLIAGGNLTSFHSEGISVSYVKHTNEEHTVLFESQFVSESQLNLLLHTAQDVWQIADKLIMVNGTRLHVKLNHSTYRPANGLDMPWIPCDRLSQSVVGFEKLEYCSGEYAET